MQREHIFSAPALSAVIKQLLIYRPTGLLSIWPAQGSRQNEIQIRIEAGRPVRIRRGRYEEASSASLLNQLNLWGTIHFIFLDTGKRLQLPPPASQHPGSPTTPLPHTSFTQPLPDPPDFTDPLPKYVSEPQQHYTTITEHANSAITPENVIPTRTTNGRDYPITNLPRYDRVIFLLIDGRRTVADLAQLTRRSPAEIHTSLTRLKSQKLVTMKTWK